MKRFLWFIIPLLMQAGTLVPEIRVPANDERYSYKAYITGGSNPNGDCVLAWLDWRDGRNSPHASGNGVSGQWPQVYVQKLVDGEPTGGNVRIAYGSHYYFVGTAPAVALFPDGMKLVATTLDDREKASDQYLDAEARLWDQDADFGSAPVAEFELDVKMPFIVPFGASSCVAVQNTPHTSIDTNIIIAQRFSRDGSSVGGLIEIDTGIVEDVIADADGSFVVAYLERPPRAYFVRCDGQGSLGEKVLLDTLSGGLSVAGSASGAFLCAWFSYDEYLNPIIYTRRFSDSDQPVGTLNEVYHAQDYAFPTCISLVQGDYSNYLLVYKLGHLDVTSDTFYGLLLDHYGRPQGEPFIINEGEEKGTIVYIWAGAGDDGYRTAWIEDETVYTRKISLTGIPGSQQVVSDDEAGVYAEFNVPVLTPDGGFFIHWSHNMHQSERTRTAYVRRFFPSGEAVGDIWGADSLDRAYPSLGLDGRFYISYCTTQPDTTHEVRVQRFNDNGTPDGAPWDVGVVETRACEGTAVAVREDGSGMAVWLAESPSNSRYGVLKTRLFDPSGQPAADIYESDTFFTWAQLQALAFSDGYLVAQSEHDEGLYVCYLFDAEGHLEREPFVIDGNLSARNAKTVVSNGSDRFLTVWRYLTFNTMYYQMYDRHGEKLGEQHHIEFGPVSAPMMMCILEGYGQCAAMAPDGRFVIAWTEIDVSGNLNMWAQLFSKDGEPISAPFQVNDADQWDYSFQISGWRGVSCNNDRILFTWLENRRHRGWDVMAKVTDWDFATITEDPAIERGNVELITPIGSEIVLRFTDCPEGFHAAIYSAAGRKVDELHASLTEGTVSWGECHGSGVYFIRELSGSSAVKVVLVR